MAQLQGIGNVVRNSVVGTIRGTGEVFDAVEETVSHSLVTVLGTVGSAGGALAATSGLGPGARGSVRLALAGTIAGVRVK